MLLIIRKWGDGVKVLAEYRGSAGTGGAKPAPWRYFPPRIVVGFSRAPAILEKALKNVLFVCLGIAAAAKWRKGLRVLTARGL